MKKLAFAVLALAFVAGFIFQLHKKSQSGPSMESAAEISALVDSQPKATTSKPSAPFANKKINTFVLGELPSETLDEEALSDLRAKITTSDLEQLSQTVCDETQPQEMRRKSLYILTQMGSAALPALTAIATTPMPVAGSQDPHSADQMKQSFEAGLRVTAIEALDDLGNDSNLSPAVKDSMLGVLKVQKHRSLTLLAQLSLSGIESGRPGKVRRAVDQMLKEKE